MAKIDPYEQGKADALAGREINNTYGDTDDGSDYVEGYEDSKVERAKPREEKDPERWDGMS